MANDNQQNKQQQIQIKAPDDILKGSYANALQVTHNKEEFVFDFMNIYPWQRLGMLNARVIVSPAHMKRMVKALQENLKKYEDQFGKIEEVAVDYDHQMGFKTE